MAKVQHSILGARWTNLQRNAAVVRTPGSHRKDIFRIHGWFVFSNFAVTFRVCVPIYGVYRAAFAANCARFVGYYGRAGCQFP